jgi:hypothetical protein
VAKRFPALPPAINIKQRSGRLLKIQHHGWNNPNSILES